MDKSNGYEENALIFSKSRSQDANGIGVSSIRRWAKTLPPNATVLDIGCGTGVPVSKVLVEEGLTVFGLDASPSMVQIFRQNFPDNPVACEAVEDSPFFNRKFDAIVAWGLVFLLTEKEQEIVLQKAAHALNRGGKFLFTAPAQKVTWEDVLTLKQSLSLGAEKYRALLIGYGFSMIEEFEDEGGNYYYHAVLS
ncbi:class I SAM-dependent methyltransferase [Dyadobacter luticola]|uniref:Class I SAM-dependent methyltransferase n=1 Tax=Dyadobacter luticola TaxID=1979387 RepID=A0A5R9KVS9_9BACT|nr:class I SAM-dependent methyltransferase [Dyadobacter luticola]TLV00373.1 class I SAM-dependent methyltransferase [Dyadobacter luticola]